MREQASDLCTVLERHRDDIAAAWAELASRLPDSRYRELPVVELTRTAQAILETMCRLAAAGSTVDLETHVAAMTVARLRQGFNVGEIIEMSLLGKEAALPFILTVFPAGSAPACAAIAQLDACLRRIVGLYGRLMQRHLETERQRTALALDAAHTAGVSFEFDQVLEQIVAGMQAAVGMRHCVIFLLDADGRLIRRAGTGDLLRARFDAVRNHPPQPAAYPFFHEVVQRRASVVCYDAQSDPRANRVLAQTLGIKSVLGLPLEAGGQLLGVALLSTFDEYHAFTPQEIELVAGIVKSLAFALANARLYDEAQRRLAESRSLQRVVTALLQKLDLQEVLEVVCLEAQRLTGAAESAVCLVDAEPERCLRVALNAATLPPTFEHTPCVGRITEQVVHGGELLLTNDPDAELQACYGATRLTTLLAVPLRGGRGLATGMLSLANKPNGFTEDDARVTSLFADQAAIAIENAQLYQQVEQLAVTEERQRLAREMHDSVTHDLYSLALYAEAAARLLAAGNIAGVAEHLHELRDTAQEALREMRLLIFELRPPMLEKAGLVAALRARLEAVEARAGFHTELRVTGERRLAFAIEEGLYRVAQEALNNAAKHARAHHVTVDLRFRDDTICLEVCDDGVGFDSATARPHGGSGLHGMEERLGRIGGKLKVESKPGQGTRVWVEVQARETQPKTPEQVRLPIALTLPHPEAQPAAHAPIRVLIADDHTIVRKGIRALLATRTDIEVVGEVSDGQQAVTLAAELRPDVILMDLVMPGLDGIEATRRIIARDLEVRILVLTSFAADEKVFPAIKAGALGYLLKDSSPDDLVQAILQVQRGESSLHPAVARKVLRELMRPAEQPQAPDRLSERETEVLRLLAQGLTNAEIAARLVVTETTVRSHVSNTLTKLHLSSRTQAVLYALREGLASLDEQAVAQ